MDLYQRYEDIPTKESMRVMVEGRNRLENQIDYANAKRDFSVWTILRTPLGLALIVFIVVVLVLLLVNPPITQHKSKSYLEEGKQDFLKVILFAGVIALIAYLTPLIYRKLCDLQAKSSTKPGT